MKTYLVIVLVFFMGCATPCPKEDIVIPLFNPISGHKTIIVLEKGVCDNPDNYMTLEEFERQKRERRMR